MFIMTAAEGVYFSNAGVLTLAGSGGTPAATGVSAIQNVTIDTHYEIAKAFGWGSIFRLGAGQYNFEVDVSIEWIKWDPTIACWMGAYVYNASAGGTVADTNTPVLFSCVTTFTSATGTLMKLTVSNIAFKNLKFDAKMGEWVLCNLEGSGSTIVITNA